MNHQIHNIRRIAICLIALSLATTLIAQDGAIQGLSERVQELEESLFYVKFVGGPILGLTTLWAAYMYFFGIRRKVNELIEQEAKTTLAPLTEKLVVEKIAAYPFIQQFEKEQAVKQQKRVRILGPTTKDIGLHRQLEAQGFQDIKSYHIKDYQNLDVNDCDVLFFNNNIQQLNQAQMDEVVTHFKGQVHFFYLTHPDAPQWKSAITDIGRIGFASSMQRIEPNLLKLFT